MANKSTVNQGSNGQFRTTVPKGLAEGFELDGKKLRWTVESSNALRVEIVDDD